jgi:CRISPR system Cascade subunit CasE
MPEPVLHLVKVPLKPSHLARVARSRNIRLRDLDEGYLIHCILRELWQENAPSPFVTRENGSLIDVWGYTAATASALTEHATLFGDPVLLEAIDFRLGLTGKQMPLLPAGKRVGFLTRVCPVKRLSKATQGHRVGAEVDAFLATAFRNRPAVTSREEAYRDWFAARVGNVDTVGATLSRVAVAGMMRTRLVRRTQSSERTSRVLERPAVYLEGEFLVHDGSAFLRFLAHGVGRHRGFGFGAVILVPPGSSPE